MTSETKSFEGKVAIVTGAGSGIGEAITLKLAAHGATLCLIGRRVQALESVARVARASARQVLCYSCDLTVEQDVCELVGGLKKDCDRVDVLVHSAGLIHLGALESASPEDFDRQYRINVRAPFVLTQALLPTLRAYQGQVVFINSLAGLRAVANSGQYCATKFALKAIADSLRLEVNKDGVRVISVYPGRTATPMQAVIFEKETGRKYNPELLMQPEDIAAMVINSLLLPRRAEVTDIFVRSGKPR